MSKVEARQKQITRNEAAWKRKRGMSPHIADNAIYRLLGQVNWETCKTGPLDYFLSLNSSCSGSYSISSTSRTHLFNHWRINHSIIESNSAFLELMGFLHSIQYLQRTSYFYNHTHRLGMQGFIFDKINLPSVVGI